jgi:lipid II isoglutaminyl synthase (glutamine-hydrolysing)
MNDQPRTSSMPTAATEFPTLRFAHMYPAMLNVAGDGGNLTALRRRCEWRGIPTEVVNIGLDEDVDYTTFDIALLHGGQDVEMGVVAADVRRQTAALRDAADAGVLMFGVCAGLQLFGHRYVPVRGPALDGAGILDLETRGGPQRFMQHAACDVTVDGEARTVVGFENHSGVTELGSDVAPFGRVVAGGGNNGRDGLEGAVRNRVYATYLHGPVLPKNPWLTDQFIRIALERRVGSPVTLAPLDDSIEERNHAVALRKAIENKGRLTAIEPANLDKYLQPSAS